MTEQEDPFTHLINASALKETEKAEVIAYHKELQATRDYPICYKRTKEHWGLSTSERWTVQKCEGHECIGCSQRLQPA